jgi:hypothetical protein
VLPGQVLSVIVRHAHTKEATRVLSCIHPLVIVWQLSVQLCLAPLLHLVSTCRAAAAALTRSDLPLQQLLLQRACLPMGGLGGGGSMGGGGGGMTPGGGMGMPNHMGASTSMAAMNSMQHMQSSAGMLGMSQGINLGMPGGLSAGSPGGGNPANALASSGLSSGGGLGNVGGMGGGGFGALGAAGLGSGLNLNPLAGGMGGLPLTSTGMPQMPIGMDGIANLQNLMATAALAPKGNQAAAAAAAAAAVGAAAHAAVAAGPGPSGTTTPMDSMHGQGSGPGSAAVGSPGGSERSGTDSGATQ